MRSTIFSASGVILLAFFLGLLGCRSKDQDPAQRQKELFGVDLDKKVIRIGLLMDTSGPTAVISNAILKGQEIVRKHIASGDSDLLPEGWTIEYVLRDHGYNPQRSVELFQEIRNNVFFIGSSMGVPMTLPLLPHLERHTILAFSPSQVEQLNNHRFTPPIAVPYPIKAMRAVDFIVSDAASTDDIRLGFVFQRDDVGVDGRSGIRKAIAHHGLNLVVEQGIAAGEADFTSTVLALRDAGATHVFLASVPPVIAGVLATAAQFQFNPKWVTWWPGWHDSFFDPDIIPSQVLTNLYCVGSMPYWGEDRPGMREFEELFERYGDGEKDFYILGGYMFGVLYAKMLAPLIKEDNLTRENLLTTFQSFDALYLGPYGPLNYTRFPYEPLRQTRILKPDFENTSWNIISDYALPQALSQ